MTHNAKNGSPPSADTCRAEITRLLAFRDFASAPQLRNFLEYILEEALAGRGEMLKERNIAIHALMRDASFDPRIDCVVRVMAGKLRRALERYYQDTAGAEAEVWIEVPRGSYCPVFRRVEPGHCSTSSNFTSGRIPGVMRWAIPSARDAARRPVLAVMPLLTITVGRKELAMAEALACETCVRLRQVQRLDVVDYLVTRHWRHDSPGSAGNALYACDFMVGGTCRRQAKQFRVTAQLTRVADGHLLWAEQFDLATTYDSFAPEDAIVARICSAVRHLLNPAPRHVKARPTHDEPVQRGKQNRSVQTNVTAVRPVRQPVAAPEF